MRTALTAALAISLLATLACRSPEDRKAEFESQAQSYFAEEKWSEAKIELMNLLQVDPDDPNAHYKLAESHWNLREFGDALWQYREAARLAPDRAEWGLRLAQVEFAAGRYDEALTAAHKVLELESDHLEALLLVGQVHFTRAETTEAMAQVVRAEELAKDDPRVLRLKAGIYARLAEYEEAEVAINRLIEVEKSVPNWALLAAFYFQTDRADEGLVALEEALKVDAEPAQRLGLHGSLANYYFSQGDTERAEKQLHIAREENPDNPQILVQLARFYAVQGDIVRAGQMLEDYAAKQPEEVEPQLLIADFHRRLGDRDRAMAAVEKALEIDATSERARLVNAEYMMETKDPNDAEVARAILAQVLEENPQSVLARFTDAKFLLADRQYEESAIRLRRVLQDQPSANAHVLLGTAYINMGQDELARSELLSALQLDATNNIARTQLAGLYLKSGNRELAIQEGQAVLEREPLNPRVRLILAQAQIGMGELEAAATMLAGFPWESEDLKEELRISAARSYRILRDIDTARGLLQQTLAGDPSNLLALRELIAVEAFAGNPFDARPAIESAIQNDDNSVLRELRGGLYLGFSQDGKRMYADEARADLEKAIELDPTNAGAHLLMGRLELGEGDQEAAVQHFLKAAEYAPVPSEPLLIVGGIYEGRGDVDGAVKMYRRVIEADASNPLAKNNLAWVLASKDDPSPEDLDEALELAQDAKESLPENGSVADTLGYVMYKKDIQGAAISLFREALNRFPEGSPGRAIVRYHLALSYERQR